MQGFGSVYMHSQAVDDVLDPVLQQFYSSSSSHSSSVLKVPNYLNKTESMDEVSVGDVKQHVKSSFLIKRMIQE